MTQTNTRRAFLITGSALVLTGCGSDLLGPPPAPQMYVMRPEFPAAAPSGPKVPWSLSVARPNTSAALAGERIALLKPGAILDFYADAQYPDALPDMVQRALIAGFESSGRVDSVSRGGDAIYSDYNLIVEIRDFQARYDVADGIPEAMVTLQVRLTRARGRVQMGSFTAAQRVPASANSVAAATQALSQGLAAAVNAIVPWALAFPAPPPMPTAP